MMSDARPILVFDSGVGGLSILERIRALIPHAPIVYAADNAWHPYGPRTEHEIATRVPALLGRLCERYHPRIIVIACNTAATIALADVRAALDLPVVGTVPAIKPAAIASKSRVIGVLGTNATVRQPYVDRLVAEFAPDCVVLRLGSADLVRIAEAKLRGTVPDREEIRAIEQGKIDKLNNPLKNAPHTIESISVADWKHPYSRELAAFPLPWVRERKFWPSVGRVDNAFGDRNLICACPPVEEYASV